MILNNTPQNEAVLSNVGEIGEFRIRNSAKAFNILSSGLYANKIKAVIRELSCNALDSHVAAGTDKPIDVHIPTYLEPYFSVRDYGTGLDHDQVTNIYTTYFESTKTNSNSFIGALGLGSKSPFSYTENFTVTAIKDGVKRIYTAFINDQGVPSIALMTTEETDEHNGVEIRFAVENQNDFYKFEQEAANVFRWFKELPNFTGKSVNISPIEYDTENLIPGVHIRKNSHASAAIMGNISYPIEVPNAEKTLGDLRHILSHGVVIEFGIGELDFQASREGLSYIPQTIESIKTKLEAINGRLSEFVAEEVDKIENEWEKSFFLHEKKRHGLFKTAVDKYVSDTNFELMSGNQWAHQYTFEINVDDFAAMNIHLRGFSSDPHYTSMSTLKPSSRTIGYDKDHNAIRETQWSIHVSKRTMFVENDTKVGALERSKHHMRTETKRPSADVYVVEPIDRSLPMKLDAFYEALHNPPESQRRKVSDLRQKDRAVNSGGLGKDVTIMQIEKRGGSRWQSASHDLVWRDAGKSSEFDDTVNHYYIPLSGFSPQFEIVKSYTSSEFVKLIQGCGIPELKNIKVFGVRKGDIEEIKKKSNWINLESYVKELVQNLGDKMILGCVVEKLAMYAIMKYNISEIVDNIHVGPARDALKEFVDVPKSENFFGLRTVSDMFGDGSTDFDVLLTKYIKMFDEITKRYPLIEKLDYRADTKDVIDYVNLIDKV